MINKEMYELGNEPSAIRELFAYGLEQKKLLGGDAVFDFSLGSPSVDVPKLVSTCIEKFSSNNQASFHGYSMAHGLLQVREKIAKYISRANRFNADASNIFITCGAAGGLAASLKAIVRDGEEVIIIAPYFPEYSVWIMGAGGKQVDVQADKSTFMLDTDAISRAITDKTAAVIINSPNNPTGVIYSKENIKALSKVLEDAQKRFNRDIYLISDEPYRKLTFGDKVPYVPKFYDNTIVCDSASKSLSLAGQRIGYCLAPNKEVLTSIAGAARLLGHVCAPVMFQNILGNCIDLPADVETYITNRDLLCHLMEAIGIEYVKPQGAFYLWIKSPIGDAQAFSDIAKEKNILIVPSDSFGVKGWLRVSFCVSTEIIIRSAPVWRSLKW